ncbi:hypothetical protein QYM36_015274 [Artemia franciscana]|uniref:Uncharacterized protein n=1 Tax=Artemia franciscana TaxID=6661 RepID=A0AA88HED6_ARTSF|nr:hypothetical protein QYM36_015274 [Artemia franciscana]
MIFLLTNHRFSEFVLKLENQYWLQERSVREAMIFLLINNRFCEFALVARALGQSNDDFSINKSSIQRIRIEIRESILVARALGLSSDDFSINKSSIQRIRTEIRESRTEAIKPDFQNNVPDVVTVHWGGKLLPGLDVRSSREERLPVIASFHGREQLFAVSKLESSSG